MKKEIKDNKICVLGLGYIGLTLAITLAEAGFRVAGIEKNKEVVRNIKEGRVHIHENGLNGALAVHINKLLEIHSTLDGVTADAYIIAVGTPVGEDKKPRLDDLVNVAQDVGKALKKGDLVCLRSTVAPTTTREIVIPILEKNSGLRAGEDFLVAFAPERTAEGVALEEIKRLPQVIGGINKESAFWAGEVFNQFVEKTIITDSLESAEMIKTINNCYRDLVFAFANEITLICDKFNLDAHEVIANANLDYKRSNIPLPSPGVGGYCLTKDPYILLDAAQKKGVQLKVIPYAREVNEFMPRHVFNKIENFCKLHKKSLKDMKIFILGFAFKGWPETSDMRFSPTLDILTLLKEKTQNIFGYDPVVKAEVIESLGVKYASFDEGFRNADCVLIMTNHPSFGKINMADHLKNVAKPFLFFDTWRLNNLAGIMSMDGVKYSNLSLDNI